MTSTQVPLITHRKRIPHRAILDVGRQIAEGFQPKKIVLFGSYARDTPRQESDVDILVIMETSLREAEQAIRICQTIDYHFGLDLIVRTPENFQRRVSLGDPFLREIAAEGITLYERTDG